MTDSLNFKHKKNIMLCTLVGNQKSCVEKTANDVSF